jgi:murein DD-endopeptidase MepM/ murein hydrolase activator NlpD
VIEADTIGSAPATAQASTIPPLDVQLRQLRGDTTELMTRASRAQERAELAELRKRKAAALAAAKRRAEALRKAAEARRPKFALPMSDYDLTATFGQTSNLWSSSHTGLDFAAPLGTPVESVSDGVIVEAGWGGPYGWRARVRHKDGTETWYCHLSSFVQRSGSVKAGEVIGRVGATGNVTGPHLHLEVRVNDQPVNPMTWLRGHGLEP